MTDAAMDPRDPGDLVDPFDGIEGEQPEGKKGGKKKTPSKQSVADMVTPLVTGMLDGFRQAGRDVLFTTGSFFIYEPNEGCWHEHEDHAIDQLVSVTWFRAHQVWPTNKLANECVGTLRRLTYRPDVPWGIGTNDHVLAGNGVTVRLADGATVPNDKAFYFRAADRTAAPWEPTATSSIWDTAIRNAFSNLPAAELQQAIDTVEEWLGTSLIKSGKPRYMQKAFVFFGEAWTGKSTLLDAMRALWGANAVSSSVSALRREFALEGFHNARVWCSDEMPLAERINEELFKQIVTDDAVSINRKFKTVLHNVKLGLTLGFSANHAPRVSDTSDAVWLRILLVPCDVRIKDTPMEIKDLREQLRLPAVRAHLLQRAFAGLQRLRQRGHFDPPKTWIEVNDTQRLDQQPVSDFARQALVSDPNCAIRSSDLVAAYKGYLAGHTDKHEAENVDIGTDQIVWQLNSVHPDNKRMRWGKRKITLRAGLRWTEAGLAWLDTGWQMTLDNYERTDQKLLDEANVKFKIKLATVDGEAADKPAGKKADSQPVKKTADQ